MDWTHLLRSQQTQFIDRLNQSLQSLKSGSLLLEYEHGIRLKNARTNPTHELPGGLGIEQLVMGGDPVVQFRAIGRDLILESDPSMSVRELLCLYLREQLTNAVLYAHLGDTVKQKQRAEYLDLNQTHRFHLWSESEEEENPVSLTAYITILEQPYDSKTNQKLEQLTWSVPPEALKQNDVVIYLWIRETVNEVCNHYPIVLAGFLPTAAHPVTSLQRPLNITLNELFYIGGLTSYVHAHLANGGAARPTEDSTPRWLSALTSASNYVYPFAISADGRIIASSSYDGSLKIWQTDNQELINQLAGQVRSLSPQTNTGSQPLSSDTAEKNLQLWWTGSAALQHCLMGHPSSISAVTLSPSAQLAITGCYDGSLTIWDLNTGQIVHQLIAHHTTIKSLVVSANERLLVSSSTDRSLYVWEIQTGAILFELPNTGDVVVSTAIDPTSNFLVSGTQDGTIQVWGLFDGQLRYTINAHAGVVQSLTINETGTLIASASIERTVKLWNLETGAAQETLTGHPDPLITLAPNSSGQWIDLSLFQHQQPGWKRSPES